MLDSVTGKICVIKEKSVTINLNGIGLCLHVPQTSGLEKDKENVLYTYLHWNQEKGPSLYGFQTELERKVFMLVIDCPKVGPSIALSILSHFTASQFLEIITSQDENRLSEVSGVGAKKAEQIIVQLKHKVQKLLFSGEIATEEQGNFVQWQNVNDVLVSLNYSKPEIASVMQHLSENNTGQNCSLDQLIRSALAFLSKQQ